MKSKESQKSKLKKIKKETTASTLDVYDSEVERLTEQPELIYFSWLSASPLFQYAGRNCGTDPEEIGCLTQIRRDVFRTAFTPELTRAIRADKRLPDSEHIIKIEHLPVFAEWQRRLDAELGLAAPTSSVS